MHMLHIVGTEAHDQPTVLALLHVHRSAQARGGDVAHEGPVRDMEQAQAAVATVSNRQAAAIRCEPHAVWSQQLPIQAPGAPEATSQYAYRRPAGPAALEQPDRVVSPPGFSGGRPPGRPPG